MHESSISKVWLGLVLYTFVVYWGSVSGWLWEWIFNVFGMDFGSILASKIDEKRDRFRESFLKVLWRGPAEINSLGKSPGEVDN